MLNVLNAVNCLTLVLILLSALPSCGLMEQKNSSSVIFKEIRIKGTQMEIWSALTTKEKLSKWWGERVNLEPVIDGEFYEPWGKGQLATGKVTEVKPQKKIRFTWREKSWDPDKKTLCEFSLRESQQDTVVLRVRHSGWEIFKTKKEQMTLEFDKGWDFILPKLKRYIEAT